MKDTYFNDNKIFRLAGEDTNHSSIILHALENFRVKKYKRDEPVIGLGHRRLSIIDVTAQGHQPMTRDGKTWITYNGEVFNYLRLKIELSASKL